MSKSRWHQTRMSHLAQLEHSSRGSRNRSGPGPVGLMQNHRTQVWSRVSLGRAVQVSAVQKLDKQDRQLFTLSLIPRCNSELPINITRLLILKFLLGFIKFRAYVCMLLVCGKRPEYLKKITWSLICLKNNDGKILMSSQNSKYSCDTILL